MELKWASAREILEDREAFNRTAYGIEIPNLGTLRF